jgi:hypothetical protein
LSIERERRKILHCNATQDPTSEWVIQQLPEAFPLPISLRDPESGQKVGCGGDRFVDRSGLGGEAHARAVAWQNALAGRWIGSGRREILDHIIALDEEILRRVATA